MKKKSIKDVPERPVSHLSISPVKENGEAIEGAEQEQAVQQRPNKPNHYCRKSVNIWRGSIPESKTRWFPIDIRINCRED